MIRKVNSERFSLTSSKPFADSRPRVAPYRSYAKSEAI